MLRNESITLNATSILRKIDTSSCRDFDSFDDTINETKLILVDVCVDRNLSRVFFEEFRDSILGFYVDLANQPNTEYFSSLVNDGKLSPNEAYVISFGNSNVTAITYLRLRQKLCWSKRTWKGRYHTRLPSASLVASSLKMSNIRIRRSNVGNSTDVQNETTNTTTATPTTAPQNTTTNTTGSGTYVTKIPIVNHSSSASVALGIVVVLLILIIVGLVFRKKIIHYVRFTLMRRRTDDQSSMVGYQGFE